MNSAKKGPYILILLLVILLIFILGVQYGKKVNVADTALGILLSITPSPSPKPSKMPVTTYVAYSHSGCRVSFLYPSYLSVETESSREAKLSSKDKTQFIKVQCSPQLQKKESTPTAVLINDFQAQVYTETVKVNNKHVSSKIIRLNRINNPVEFTINTELEPLITTSIELQ